MPFKPGDYVEFTGFTIFSYFKLNKVYKVQHYCERSDQVRCVDENGNIDWHFSKRFKLVTKTTKKRKFHK